MPKELGEPDELRPGAQVVHLPDFEYCCICGSSVEDEKVEDTSLTMVDSKWTSCMTSDENAMKRTFLERSEATEVSVDDASIVRVMSLCSLSDA